MSCPIRTAYSLSPFRYKVYTVTPWIETVGQPFSMPMPLPFRCFLPCLFEVPDLGRLDRRPCIFVKVEGPMKLQHERTNDIVHGADRSVTRASLHRVQNQSSFTLSLRILCHPQHHPLVRGSYWQSIIELFFELLTQNYIILGITLYRFWRHLKAEQGIAERERNVE